ncbi:MAG: hypothetical protein A2750_01275 [Candidatus Yanofskybacteria bacterium RIFCSPHIGHO2_01_FULL_45_42]|uniref:Transglycosylase SLT domain-containing protein n=3 Tax=Candidatus Yanofskyibacteriota TaxID=1752733 RepID=A0A1F8H6G9_9BACT|nr:MAG: hypothetical protein A2750_01275 [Candidatus Yanofskybacteria bacterium RIFCSPHIGHO2_01_FULL_45_42]OGN16600.1 MAG: hypothetical protein A3C81_02430 [Candidatus Yanofskybacteria bacterium RIFCSPHIGHO2_02_FULL_46_19]OGN26572.1 MAG: hypothetical protein A3B17_00765 [Candidatus Yanofskybacteria bacterium RIFCSPLOWO2_01_FULL_45_72]OGN32628.1 MAG: hypothetical protein A3J01_01550 [Candidatus Yanofskybacteria bacterium RIFCSPLOWO2_02_FULL_45_18]
MILSKKSGILSAIFLLAIGYWLLAGIASAAVQDEIDKRNQQIEELQRQIEQYQQQVDSARGQSRTLENEIAKLNAKINQLTLEIKILAISIDQTGIEINDTEGKINEAQSKIILHRQALAQYLKLAYQIDQKTLTEILLQNHTLSDFFNNLNNLNATQDNLRLTIDNIKKLKGELEQRQQELEDKRQELKELKSLQELQKKNLGGNKNDKSRLLTITKGQESKFQELVKKSQSDIGKIRAQVTYLQQYGVSAEDAVKYGQLAAIAANIRPAFLIAILEIESGLGRNVGTGNWMQDMYTCYLRLGKPQRAETEKNAFLAIVNKLGLNPDTVKVSREPNYGCGGALGPAQFLPSTWLAYENEVARLTGHNPPNPWSIEDAFMASAIKLANGGATSKDRTGETRAAKAYISGKPTCTSRICNYYASAVLNKADQIEPNL